jgi:flagellar biosynthesis anti-sigma factor FlgM
VTNKISGLNPSALPDALPSPVQGGGAPSTAGATPSSAGDVHITDSASQLASLEQTLRSLPAVDPARVAYFQSAIEQGTYTVQPRQVADQLIQLESALGHLAEG